MEFGHEKLEVYNASLEFVAFVSGLVGGLSTEHRNARDQLVRSSQSIPLNIAEGNGKRSLGERRRFFEIARGSATESAATLDVLTVCGGCTKDHVAPGKALLVRIVSMLTKMTERCDGVARETENDYDYDHDHDHDSVGAERN